MTFGSTLQPIPVQSSVQFSVLTRSHYQVFLVPCKNVMLIFTAPQREFVFMTIFLKPEAINESELKQCKTTAKPKLLPTMEQLDSTEHSDVTWASLACTEPKCQTWLCYYSSFLAILTRGKYHKAVGFRKDSH